MEQRRLPVSSPLDGLGVSLLDQIDRPAKPVVQESPSVLSQKNAV
jgi:hypothetical protein